jgi:hypothetical protein
MVPPRRQATVGMIGSQRDILRRVVMPCSKVSVKANKKTSIIGWRIKRSSERTRFLGYPIRGVFL